MMRSQGLGAVSFNVTLQPAWLQTAKPTVIDNYGLLSFLDFKEVLPGEPLPSLPPLARSSFVPSVPKRGPQRRALLPLALLQVLLTPVFSAINGKTPRGVSMQP